MTGPAWAAGAGAGAATGGDQAATGAGAGAATGAGAGAAPPARCLRYSSNEGASEMDLRGSSWVKASGSRVSAIPPAPMTGPLNKAVERALGLMGEKAEALTARPRTIILEATGAMVKGLGCDEED